MTYLEKDYSMPVPAISNWDFNPSPTLYLTIIQEKRVNASSLHFPFSQNAKQNTNFYLSKTTLK